MNVLDKVSEVAARTGWQRQSLEEFGQARLTARYTKDQTHLLIQYRLFGTPSNYMLRYYGKDPQSGINWGIESAHVKVEVEREGGIRSWMTAHIFDGANKKRQVLAFMRENQ